MSGRSAYVRKKITETKAAESQAGRGRTRSIASSDDAATINDHHGSSMPPTGVNTASGRFLKFSEPLRAAAEPMHDAQQHMSRSIGSSTGSSDGRRDGGPGSGSGSGLSSRPLEDYAYARARRPNIRTEDVSGIEKSGLRSAVDKKSEGVRRGLVKAFTFGKKGNKKEDASHQDNNNRPPSVAATLRPSPMSPMEMDEAYEAAAAAHHNQMQQQQQQQQQQKQQPLQPQPQPQLQYAQAAPEGQGWEPSLASPPPSAKLPPVPTAAANAPIIKRWIGAGRPVQRWNKLRKDPELWDPNGDVLVFLGHKGQQPRPNPSFRLSSHIIEATESRFLITLLREGSTDEEDMLHNSTNNNMPPSPVGAPPMLRGGPNAHLHHQGRQQHGRRGGPYGTPGQPTPPISEDTSLADADGQISYEMYFPTLPSMNKVDQLRHHITTRNIFALLYHASLVGLTLYQALSDLQARLEAYMQPEMDSVGTIINYLGARGIDDVRNDPENAVSLLAWSESPDVRWEEGWRESFLHSAGMFASIEACADFKNLTPITRALLERASLETQLRVQAAEERLAEFCYADMWPPSLASSSSSSNGARAAAERMQKFLITHYTNVYGRWPPLPPPSVVPGSSSSGIIDDDDTWLTRTLAQAVQTDFAALYDYLVDRDIVWDGSEARAGRKWMLVSESGNRAFAADTPDLPMTDMLVEFDNRQRFPHIPHPYPLVPDSIPPSTTSITSSTTGSKDKTRATGAERRVHLAYTVATNMLILGSDFHQSDLIDAFSKFEKADHVGEVDPATARRGRWVLVYGILQTLASVSVDALNMRYRDGVAYHLSPRLKGAKMPPWRTSRSNGPPGTGDEAAHELSHCWLVPLTWKDNNNNDNSSASHSPNEENSPTTSSSGEFDSSNSPVRRNSIVIGGNAYSFPSRVPGGDLPSPHGIIGSANTPYGKLAVRATTSSAALSAVGGGGGGGAPGDRTSTYSGSNFGYAQSHRGSVVSGGSDHNVSRLPSSAGRKPSTPGRTHLTADDAAAAAAAAYDYNNPLQSQSQSQHNYAAAAEDSGSHRQRRHRDREDRSVSRGPRDKSSSSRRQQQQQERPLMTQDIDDLIIRDFDMLDVIDDHDP